MAAALRARRGAVTGDEATMAKAVGIDLGTTNSVIAVSEGGKPTVIPNAEGARTTPSVVAFTPQGERLVAQLARRQAILNPKGTIYSAKRFIGRRFDEVKSELNAVSFDVVPGPNGEARFEIRGKQYAPEEISALVLRKLAEDGSKFLGEGVTEAVIPVPAYFNDARRQATRDAGRIAGLEVLRLVNEPTAAALAYGLHEKKRGRVAVYDLGGGTFDISVLKLISTSDGDIFQVLSTNGDTHLGGDDIDNLLQAFVHERILQSENVDFSPHSELAQDLRKSLIAAKHELSEKESVTFRFALPGGKTFVHNFSRADFEALIQNIVNRTMAPMKQALADAHLAPSAIEE